MASTQTKEDKASQTQDQQIEDNNNAESQPEQAETNPTTGIPQLDERIDRLTDDAQVAAYVILDTAIKCKELADKIQERLWANVGKFTDVETLDAESMGQAETAAEVSWWLAFWQGMAVAHKEE